MRIVFFGTGKFGIPTLKSLLKSEHEIVAVVSQPDKKKGRGWDVLPTQVKAFMEQSAPAVEIFQPAKTSEPEFIDWLREQKADVFIVIDYGKLLVEEILALPKKCSINLHPSLLPKYRGAAPVNWAILNGEKETGNSVIRMSGKMDAGSVIAQEKTEINEDETALELSERLSQSGAELVMKVLSMIGSDKAEFIDQKENEASHAPKLKKSDGVIDWSRSAFSIMLMIRGLQPWPGAFTKMEGKTLKIFKGRVVCTGNESMSSGTVIDEEKFLVRTGEGALEILELQIEGKRRMQREEFLRGHRIEKGMVLGG